MKSIRPSHYTKLINFVADELTRLFNKKCEDEDPEIADSSLGNWLHVWPEPLRSDIHKAVNRPKPKCPLCGEGL